MIEFFRKRCTIGSIYKLKDKEKRKKTMTVNLDWENLGFSYMKLPHRYIAYYRNGQWEEGKLTEDATLHISESSPSLHYG